MQAQTSADTQSLITVTRHNMTDHLRLSSACLPVNTMALGWWQEFMLSRVSYACAGAFNPVRVLWLGCQHLKAWACLA